MKLSDHLKRLLFTSMPATLKYFRSLFEKFSPNKLFKKIHSSTRLCYVYTKTILAIDITICCFSPFLLENHFVLAFFARRDGWLK